MDLRQFVSENFAGGLEYHPRRGIIYLVLGVALGAGWHFTVADLRLAQISTVMGLGSFAFLYQGDFLSEESSEGLGMSYQELEKLNATAKTKPLPSFPEQVAQHRNLDFE